MLYAWTQVKTCPNAHTCPNKKPTKNTRTRHITPNNNENKLVRTNCRVTNSCNFTRLHSTHSFEARVCCCVEMCFLACIVVLVSPDRVMLSGVIRVQVRLVRRATSSHIAHIFNPILLARGANNTHTRNKQKTVSARFVCTGLGAWRLDTPNPIRTTYPSPISFDNNKPVRWNGEKRQRQPSMIL